VVGGVVTGLGVSVVVLGGSVLVVPKLAANAGRVANKEISNAWDFILRPFVKSHGLLG